MKRRRQSRRAEQPHHAALVFPRLARLLAAQIVAARSGVGLEIAERRLLGFQGFQQRDQYRVLEHVGKISGVERMAVIHV